MRLKTIKSKQDDTVYTKYVFREWLIAGFNENFMNREKELPLDLPIPDYTKLLQYTS